MNVQRVHKIINIKPDTVPDLRVHSCYTQPYAVQVSQRGRVTRVRVTVQVKKTVILVYSSLQYCSLQFTRYSY